MRSINAVELCTPLDTILKNYETIFSSDLGCLKGQKVALSVKPNCVPKFFKPRTVPFALKNKVEMELNRLQQQGVISPIAEWAAPIVPIAT